MVDLTRRGVVGGVVAAPLAAGLARAQSGWPMGVGPIRLIVPFPAGGSVDAVARLVQSGLQQRLGAPVIVENQPGSSGSIGTTRAARAAPDGTTWLFVFDTHAVNPAMQKLTFDTLKDLEPVMLVGTAPNVLATAPSKPYRSLADVVAAAKERPDGINYGTIGIGSIGHLTMVRLGRQAGAKLTHVPYRGGGPALNDAIAGHVELVIGSAALVGPQLEAKGLVPVAQFGATRVASPNLKDVPTASESGFPGLEALAWWGVLAPAQTPQAMIERFHADLKATLADERVNRVLAETQQVGIVASSPAELQSFVAEQMRIWGAVVRENNIKADS